MSGIDLPQRRPNHLKHYDYSAPGAYFVTVCTRERRCVLSSIRRGDPCGRPENVLTEYGLILEECLRETETLYGVRFPYYIIMPNHVHFICRVDEQRATARVAPTLGRIVGAFKSMSANRCRTAGLSVPLWQRFYYDHVIRNDDDYNQITEYIETNPAKWPEDRFFRE